MWCESCGYNAESDVSEPELPRAARREARNRTKAERLYERLRTAKELRPTSGTKLAVLGLATLVHAIAAALFAGSILLIASWPQLWSAWAAGLLGIGVAVAVRPRFLKRLRAPRTYESWLTRHSAPKLFALLDRCAGQLGARVPERVALDDKFNARTASYGLPSKSYLCLGIPLWSVLSGPERVALLGHELGHQVNGDVTSNFWVWSARRSLEEWMRLFDPRESRLERAAGRRLSRMGGMHVGLAAVLAPYLMFVLFLPVCLLVLGCSRALARLDLACRQRAEYLADEFAARLGSSAGALGLMNQLALGESVGHYLRRQRVLRRAAAAAADPWPGLREYLDSVPQHELRRRIRVQELHGTRIDSTHPANYLRRNLLAARPQLPGTIELDDAEWAGIDAELGPRCAAVGRRVLGFHGLPHQSRLAGQPAAGTATKSSK